MISRKEFMKKYLSIIVLSLCSFFLFGFKVSALDVNINFDNHDHFNFFYEMKEDTPFYRFLIGQGENLKDYLHDLYNADLKYLEIHYVSDIIGCDQNVDCNQTMSYIPENAYYLIYSSNYNKPYVNFNDNVFSVYYDHYSTTSRTQVYYFFDEDSNYLGKYSDNSSPVAPKFHFYNSDYNVDNFEYFISSLYYFDDSITYYSNNSTPNIRIKSVVIDNTEYILSSDNWLSNIWHGIVSFFTGAEYLSYSGYGLEYFRKDYVITSSKGFSGLINVLSLTDDNVSVPGNYQSKSFSLTDELHLYPLTSCSVDDIALYVRANSDEKFTIFLNSVNEEDEFTYRSSYYAEYVPKVNRFIKLNPLNVLDTNSVSTNIEVSDFTKFIYRLSRLNNFNVYTVYYNPSCYSSVYVGESLEWTNPNSSNTIIVSPDYDNWTDPENIGSGNSIGFFDSPYNAEDLLQTGWSNAGSFVSAANTIVSLTFTLFNEMPPEMQALLFMFFSIGLVLIILKIFL